MTAPQSEPVPREDIRTLVLAEQVAMVYGAIPAGIAGTSIVAGELEAALRSPKPGAPQEAPPAFDFQGAAKAQKELQEALKKYNEGEV